MAKIVFTRESAPEHECGVHTVVERQVKGLMSRGNEIYDVYSRYPGTKTTAHVFRMNPMCLGKHRFSRFPWLDLFGQRKLRRWLKGVDPDVVHCHGTQQTTDHTIKATRWCEKVLGKRTKLILQLHTDEEQYTQLYGQRWPKWMINLALLFQARRSRRLAESVDTVIAPTENFAARFRQFTGFAGAIEVLPSQSEIFKPMNNKAKREFATKLRETHHLAVGSKQWPLISVIGRVAVTKNLEMTLRVFARVIEILKDEPAQNFHQPCLLFVGEEDNEKFLRQLKKLGQELGLENITSFAGFLPYQETAQVHQVSSVEIRISLTETNDMVLVEEMAYDAVPVVIEGTAQDEILGNPELTCQLDVDEIAQLIIKILDDETFRTKMIERNRVKSLLYQDSEAYMQTLLGLYGLPL